MKGGMLKCWVRSSSYEYCNQYHYFEEVYGQVMPHDRRQIFTCVYVKYKVQSWSKW